MTKPPKSADAPGADSNVEPDDADKDLFREAVSGAKPLAADSRAPQPRRTTPRARFRRREEQEVLRESLHGDYDPRDIDSEDNLLYHRASVGKRTMRQLARGSFAVQDELDLHGMTSGEAHSALENFISDACRSGLTCVRIVHGKGLGSGERGPVLKRKVASLLRRWDQVLAFVSARQVDGGTGAVYVLLEKS